MPSPDRHPADGIDEVTDDTPSRCLSIDNLAVGQTVIQHIIFSAEMLQHFDAMAKDSAPVHNDPRFARARGFDAPIIHGLAVSTRFSRLLGMYLPGEGTILEKIELKYRRPTYVGQRLTYRCTVSRIFRAMNIVQLSLTMAVEGVEHVTGQCQCLLL